MRVGALLHATVHSAKPGVSGTVALPPVKALGAMQSAMQTAAIRALQTALEITAKPTAAMKISVSAMHGAKELNVKLHLMG